MKKFALILVFPLIQLLFGSCAENTADPFEENIVEPTIVIDSLGTLGCCPSPPKCCN